MHIPLAIAVLALLAFALLPALDRTTGSVVNNKGPTRLLGPYRTLGEGVSQPEARQSRICTFAETVILFN